MKVLLKSGALDAGGTIILDEPEIHLHPAWQLAFAEIIVLLQKELGMHVLMSTHSPYFLKRSKCILRSTLLMDCAHIILRRPALMDALALPK